MDYRNDSFDLLRQFLTYHETIRGHSRRTVDEYYLDLRNFFRYIKIIRGLAPRSAELDEVSISDVDLPLIRSIRLTDVYEYLSYLKRDRVRNQQSRTKEQGLGAASLARKTASIRSFYKFLTSKVHLLDENPVQDLDAPKQLKGLPRYLTLEESVRLLGSVSGADAARDYCILTLFLNCGMRISELVGINFSDIREDSIRILGKGNKERVVYLNDACVTAINRYLDERKLVAAVDKNALFLSNRRRRMSTDAVHHMVKKRLLQAGLDSTQYSAHKLRHTAATLMLKNGVDVRTLQELLGHEHLNTTEIYTHVDSDNLRTAARANPLSKIKPKD
ncbi:MAG TPA: tyrosine recombinase XerC [Oscillospiraceae bacterium]|nr:tyrosine recombinase XerC [Oscillospiraceae bacterium]